MSSRNHRVVLNVLIDSIVVALRSLWSWDDDVLVSWRWGHLLGSWLNFSIGSDVEFDLLTIH